MVSWAMDTNLAALDCEIENPKTKIGIFLRLLPEDGQFARVMLQMKQWIDCKADLRRVSNTGSPPKLLFYLGVRG